MTLIKLTKTKVIKVRAGRGTGGKKGKTAGRGTKGQKSRTGYNIPRGFEGGQTKLIARIPKKKGFSIGKDKTITVNSDRLKVFKKGELITLAKLVNKNIIKSSSKKVKIVLGRDKYTDFKIKGIQASKRVYNKANIKLAKNNV